MKKFRLLLLMILTVAAVTTTEAQTYFTPMNFSSQKEDVNLRLMDGSTFQGIKSIGLANGRVISVSYFGTLTKPSGTRFVTTSIGNAFDKNFNFPGGTLWCITPNGEIFAQTYQNGRMVSQVKELRTYKLNGPYIEFPQTYSGGTYTAPNYGNSYSGGNSSGGSNYNRHEATCGGCHGSGRCQHCGGTGYVNNYKSKCSLCHGRGTCVSCAGTGKIHGNY